MILNVKHIYFRVLERNLFFLCTTIFFFFFFFFVEIRMYRTELYLFCASNYERDNDSEKWVLCSYWNNEEQR